MEIKNIDELNAQVKPLTDLTLDKDISFEDALEGCEYLYKTLRKAISEFAQPEGIAFFESSKGKYTPEKAKIMLKFLGIQRDILKNQIKYRKYRANGGKPIDYFEWD